MIELRLTMAAEIFAREIRAKHNNAGAPDRWKSDRDYRWMGFAVEYEIDRFLTANEIPHVWNGGLDPKPDFEIGDWGIAVKSNLGDEGRPDFQFIVNEPDVHRLADGAIFAITNLRRNRIWLAGYLSAPAFRSMAERHDKGDEGFVPGRKFQYACRTLRADALVPAEKFFELLKLTTREEAHA